MESDHPVTVRHLDARDRDSVHTFLADMLPEELIPPVDLLRNGRTWLALRGSRVVGILNEHYRQGLMGNVLAVDAIVSDAEAMRALTQMLEQEHAQDDLSPIPVPGATYQLMRGAGNPRTFILHPHAILRSDQPKDRSV